MSGPSVEEYRARLRDALSAIKQLRGELDEERQQKAEPIAIVGMGMRFPGGISSPEAFWNALLSGVDAVREIDRWSPDLLRAYPSSVRWASLLDEIDKFDAGFFGISPREALRLDPQQRLLLEVTWEALEDAGQVPSRWTGSKTGVYVGLTALDYQQRLTANGLEELDAYCLTGNLLCTAAGRLSFVLGLEGPCVSIDTACSSSLVSVHLACQSLRTGESDMALAGGVNAILWPAGMAMLSATNALSPDGRCKTFDATANGYVRGEGCGMLVLKRLSDAKRDGDRIWGLLRGSAVNQDGRSTGLTTPNVLAQQAVIERALANAAVLPESIGYVEAHGTGTPLGDPIEMDGLKRVFGRSRPGGLPLVVGALKTNLGHLESAAGVAGLIKAVLVLNHGKIPRNNHFHIQNPRISLEGTPIAIASEPRDFVKREGLSRLAGVSSFGISGTNAHVIVEEPPSLEARAPEKLASAYLLPLSAKSPEALSALARRFAEDNGVLSADHRLDDIVYTAGVRRAHHEHRLAVTGRSREELRAGLLGLGRGEAPAGAARGKVSAEGCPQVIFVFSGQGSQWAQMGKALFEEEPVFREAIESCDALLRAHVSFSLLDELWAPEERSRLGETEIAQPAIFAVEVALARLLLSWGIRPDVVVGHSIGEVAAAHVAGILSLEEAVRLVAWRGRIMQRATGLGKMASVAMAADEAERVVAAFEGRVALAAMNDPGATVLSGEAAALDEITQSLAARGVNVRPLRVNYAFHSPQMEPLARELVSALGHVPARRADVRMISTVTGAAVSGEELDAAYWGRNVRQAVRFAPALEAALERGRSAVLEVGPHPVLAMNVEAIMASRQIQEKPIFTLRRRGEERLLVLEAVAGLYSRGVDPDWSKLAPEAARSTSLPSYQWQKERYWVEMPTRGASSTGASSFSPLLGGGHSMLGVPLTVAAMPRARFWERAVGCRSLPWLSDHRIHGDVVFPGTGYLGMALAAAAETFGRAALSLQDVTFERMLSLSPDEERRVQLTLTEDATGRSSFEIASHAGGAWVRHAKGSVARGEGGAPPRKEPPGSRVGLARTVIEADQHYRNASERGMSFGPSFRGLSRAYVLSSGALARVVLPDEAGEGGDLIHPAMLDACLQAAAWAFSSEKALEGRAFVPVGIERLRWYGPPGKTIWVDISRPSIDAGANVISVDLALLDDGGNVSMQIEGLRLQALEGANQDDPLRGVVYEVEWRRVDALPETQESAGAWLFLVDRAGTGERLASLFRERGAACVIARAGERFAQTGQRSFVVNPEDPDDLRRLAREARAEVGAIRGVAHLLGLDAVPWGKTTRSSLENDLRVALGSALSLVKALVREHGEGAPRLFLVTRGAEDTGGDEGAQAPTQAALVGLGKTILMEHPELLLKTVDLDPSHEDPRGLLRELVSDDKETRIALRRGERFAPRLLRASFDREEAGSTLREPSRGRPFQLEIDAPGVLSSLTLREIERRPPGPLEVEIEVEAAALNFIDVMKAMGLYPGLPAGPIKLGVECAGRITRFGEGVTGFVVGQEVIASTLGCFASHVVAPALLVAPKPKKLDFVQASTIPSVFSTVHYALSHVARAKRGESILIHSASGGTGLAAVQLSHALGLRIYATAGSEEKRAFLRSLGVEHVMDSRSLDFADEIMRLTGGRGVDIVLNSLSGAAIPKSLGVLGLYGRFLELGKRDIYEDMPLGLLPFRKSLSYTAIDLAGMGAARPELYASILREVVELFENGTFSPQPTQIFAADRVEEAFRLMAQAKHIGKIVVAMRQGEASIAPLEGSGRIRSDASYLITGGLGGLGLSLARFLVAQGARHLALAGRRAPSADARRTIEAMRQEGAEVEVIEADVSSEADVSAMFATIDRHMPPLRGIVHAAAVLADRTIVDLGREDLERVLAPKALGAFLLHDHSKDRALDFFVLYSSIASLLGSPGQANYVAANAVLDALARTRTLMGLPAMSVQWGPFSGVGLAAQQANRGERVEGRGLGSLTPDEGNKIFARLLTHPRPEVAITRLDLGPLREYYPDLVKSPFFSEIEDAVAVDGAESGDPGLRSELLSAPPDDRLGILEAHVLSQIGQVLRLDPSRVDREAPFSTFGIDSLMGLELRNRLEKSLGLGLSPTLVFGYPTVVALAEHLFAKLELSDAPAEPSATEGAGAPAHETPEGSTQAAGEAAETSQPAEDDVEALLEAKLAALGKYLD